MAAMKKSLYMFLAAALLALSCERTVETIWSDQNEPILVLNAQLMQDEPSHMVYVHCSDKGRCGEVTDAEVECSVNGAPAIKATPVVTLRELFNGATAEEFRGYRFYAELSAGDKVSVRASWNGLAASAAVTVPERDAIITAVDTSMLVLGRNEGYDDPYITRQYRILVQDAPGRRNYYMLRFEDVFYRLDASGDRMASYAVAGSFDSTDDYVLHPVETAVMEDFIGQDNRFNTFTDEMFSGASHTLKVTDGNWALYDLDWAAFWNGAAEGEMYCMDRRIKVYTITFDEYMYLRAIDAAGNDIGLMTEPVIYPGNVSGGLGFVTVATPAVWILEFPAETYTGEPPYNAYRYIN